MIPESLISQVTPKVRTCVDWWLLHLSTSEDPAGSNRGPEIDDWCREFGSPLGSYWCGLPIAKGRKVAGLWFPTHDAGSCDEWIYQAFRAGLVTSTPSIGCAVVYTNGKKLTTGRYAGQLDAVHIGGLLRVKPIMQSAEGNTTLGKYDRNGYTMAQKAVDLSRVYAYILPERAS